MNDYDQTGSCKPREIARNGLGRIWLCTECGVYHVELPGISVRFEAEAFDRFLRLALLAATQRPTPVRAPSEQTPDERATHGPLH
jgi:hypothetical protein